MLYLAHGKIRKFKFTHFRWHFDGLDAVKSQNFSIFTGTTVDTAVGNPMNFVNCNETGLLKTRFFETLNLGEDKVKLACSLFPFNLFV